MKQEETEWFESWFDSPFYHILYSYRNSDEAKVFLDALNRRLHLPPHSRVLDLACGKGRHSRYLNELGYQVTGVDLSEQNIAFCKQYENETIEFYVHDMRRVLRINYFDAIFNLFTSFGYFDTDHENEKVIQSASAGLCKGGYFIIDYFNASKTLLDIKSNIHINRGNIDFNISKKTIDNFIIKDIEFKYDNIDYHFTEKVRIYTPVEITAMLIRSDLNVLAVYGDYNLSPYINDESSRLIILSRKV